MPDVSRLPTYAELIRSLEAGMHAYTAVLPGIAASPALARVAADATVRQRLVAQARVHIRAGRGYAFVDVETPCIVLSDWYYREGDALDLYLDLVHELTHLRQLEEGFDLWDERFAYIDRPTEVEAYAVAVEEGRRLGMTGDDVVRHLSNPWMSDDEVQRLLASIDLFLTRGELLNREAAREGARRSIRKPW